MVTITLLKTTPTQKQGEFIQDWDVNGKQYRTTSEWGNIDFHGPADDPVAQLGTAVVLAQDVITLAIHGEGPTQDGESKEWPPEVLVSTLKVGGYLS